MNSTGPKKIILELNEHDASQILALVRKEKQRSNKIWRPYWERKAEEILECIERASFVQTTANGHHWPTEA
ncbi:MAG: hypothetical protein U0401_05315 [Anaerolineae bacterium]